MKTFRVIILLWLIVMVSYTTPVMARHGLDFASPFFTIVKEAAWPGQFALDLLGFLLLTFLWISWRHGLSVPGVLLALLTATGGMIGVSLYLLYASARCGGDPAQLLLGVNGARRG